MKKYFKKLLSVVVAIVLIFSTVSTVGAQSSAAVLDFGNAYALDDSNIMIPITISGNNGIMGFGINVSYDADVLIPLNAECSISGMCNDSIETASPGNFDLFWCSTENSTHNGNLFMLEFAVISGKADESTTISLDYYSGDTFDEDYRDVELDCRSKTIDLSGLGLNGSYNDRCEATGHDYQSVAVEADCTTNGYTQYTCRYCGVSYKEDGEPATGHSYNTQTVEVSCGSDGYVLHTCRNCGDEYKTDVVEAKGHNYILIGEDQDRKYYQCSLCGDEKTNDYVSDQLSVSIKGFLASDDGRTLTFPVSISNNSGFMGLGLKFSYDSNVLRAVSVSCSDSLNSGMFNDSISQTSNGSFDVFWSGTQNNDAEGEIMQITFEVISDIASVTAVDVDYYDDSIFDESWENIETVCNGITLDTALYADINGDATVDVKDIVRFKKCFAQIEKCTIAADVNCDNEINTKDLAHLRKILLSHEDLYDILCVKQNLSEVDGNFIISQLKDLSCDIKIATDNAISENNPYLPEEISGYALDWSISNTDNYEISDNRISVKDYDNIIDETLSLKASMTVAGETFEREFDINTKIIRMEEQFNQVDTAGFSGFLKRNSSFSYIPEIASAIYNGFSAPVKPVCDVLEIEYDASGADGSLIAYSKLFDVENGKYTIKSDAPLGAQGVIKVFFGHTEESGNVCDYSYSQQFEIAETVYKVSFNMNGGKVIRKSDNTELLYENYAEESVMFEGIEVSRLGYTFEGFYTDEECIRLFCDSSLESAVMPSEDITLFAKWKAKSFNIYFDPLEGTCNTESISALCDVPLGTLPTADRTGYTFNGWVTASDEKVSETTAFSTEEDVILYADWSANVYNVSFNATGGQTDVENISVIYDSTYGELPVAVRAGYEFIGWYNAEKGGALVTSDTAVEITQAQTLYAYWNVIEYTVSWNTGTGYTITVNRTASPNVGAETGRLSSGDKIYLGDILEIVYTNAEGYSITSQGLSRITVSDNVTSSSIYATAKLNSYTYNIVYKSSNGTALGSTTATYNYGTTNTISPKAFTGYTTPSSQSVNWDSTTAKTVTFTYVPVTVSSTQYAGSGHWWYDSTNKAGVDYYVTVETRNRTANSIQVRVVWTNTITRAAYGYAQYYNATIGGSKVSNILIASAQKWPYANGVNQNGSSTGTSGWVNVSVSATATSLSISTYWWDSQRNGSWENTFKIPAF